MKILTISGKAQHGKDTFANFLKVGLENTSHKVLITHYGDLLKYVCKTFFGWNGIKDVESRGLLQRVGTDKIRNMFPNFWVDFITKILTVFSTEWDFVLIPDCRFPNEVEILRESFGDNVVTVRINRAGFDNGLTEEQQNHPSETKMDNYNFDYYIENYDDLETLADTAHDFMEELLEGCGCCNE